MLQLEGTGRHVWRSMFKPRKSDHVWRFFCIMISSKFLQREVIAQGGISETAGKRLRC